MVPSFTYFMTREATISGMRNFANTPVVPSLLRYIQFTPTMITKTNSLVTEDAWAYSNPLMKD